MSQSTLNSVLPAESLFRQALARLLPLTVLGVGLALTAVFAYYAVASITTKLPITYPEGAHVAAIMRLRLGESLYPAFLSYPLVITPYPPGLYLLGAIPAWLFSLDAYATTVVSRGLTLTSSVGVALLVAALAQRESVSRLAAWSAAALFLPIPLLDHWGFSVRPDLPAIFLSLAAGWVLLRPANRTWLWLAGLLAGVALLTKLTAISMPMAAVLWLISRRRVADGATFSFWTLATLTLGGGFTLILSGGEALGHIVIAHLNPLLSVEHALQVFLELPTLAWFPFAAALVALSLQISRRRIELSGVYWLITLGVGLYSLRGRGGDVNYLIEAAAATCWLAAHTLHVVWSHLRNGKLRFAGLAMLLAAASLVWGSQTLQFWRREGGVLSDRQMPLAEIAATESVLAEEPTMVLLAGKSLAVSDPFHLSMLQTAGRYDPDDLIQRIRRREYSLIVLRGDARQTRYINGQPKWPESVRRAIAEYYVVSKRVDLYWLYVPDSPRPSRASGS
ncbi:MAG: ArnT family glycosyltransferase [Chloroflexota bacterium]